MKTIWMSCVMLACILLGAGSSADEDRKGMRLQASGIVLRVEQEGSEDLRFVTDVDAGGVTYYVYTREVIAALTPYIGKEVTLSGQIIPTTDGRVMHIVWLHSVLPVE